MDFNLDDPLEDLLSDASEDSFSKFLTKKPANKSKVDNLFGIDSKNSEPLPQSTSINPTPTVTKPLVVHSSPAPIIKTTAAAPLPKTVEPQRSSVTEQRKTAPPKKEITFDDNDDLFSDLGFDPRKPKTVGKKSNILDDLLGVSDTKKPPKSAPSGPRPLSPMIAQPAVLASSHPTAKQTSLANDITEMYSIDKTKTGQGYSPSVSRPRTATSSKRNSTVAEKPNDPLGFFTTTSQTKPTEEKRSEPRPNQRSSSSLDWLGLGTKDQEKPPANEPVFTNSTNQTPQNTVVPPNPNQSHFTIPLTANIPLSNIFNPNPSQTAQLLTHVNADSETAMQHLRQQETQLQVATQMRHQELALVELQRRQHDMLQQQEHHFNALLQKQLLRQSTLDDNIRQQQERINSHLSMLMMVPPTTGVVFEPKETANGGLDELLTTTNTSNGVSGETFVELRVENKRLQMENLRLSDLCEHTKENHEKEMDLMETSHRKQMECVEENLNKLETRLRQENTNLEEFYGKKMDELIGDKVHCVQEHDELVRRMIDERASLRDQLKTQHAQEIGQIRSDHMEMIEHMRKSKNLEFALVQENSSYLETLKSASGYLETASEDLQNIRVDFEAKIERIHQEREIQLLAREKRCEDQQRHFDKLRESTEAERSALLNLVRTLELKLSSVNQSSEEEQWAMRQQLATLDAERTAFERERTFVRDRIEREEKRLEEQKITQADEFRRLAQKIEDDRMLIVAEKMKLDTMARLQRPNEASVSRLEIDAAVQVAQDAARQHDLERERLVEMQRTYEHRKRELIDQENALRNKQGVLESAMSSILVKDRNADAKLSGCKSLEQKFQLKLRLLQQNGQELADRQAKLSQERYDLSRDRLELQAMRRKVFESRCSLCKIGERSQQLGEMLAKSGGIGTKSMSEQQQPDVADMDVGPIGGGAHGRFEADNLDAMLDHEMEVELQKLKQYGLSAGDDDQLLDPELMMHRLDVMKVFDDF